MSSRNPRPYLPDLTFELRRDGTVLSFTGGEDVPPLRDLLERGTGWSRETADLLRQLARRCIAAREPVEGRLREAGLDCELRIAPRGPDRVVCTVRGALAKPTDRTPDDTGIQRRPGLERRGFTRRLRDRLALSTLNERPLALALIHVEGLSGIAQAIGARVADRVMAAVLQSLPPGDADASGATDLIGRFGDDVIALVLGNADRRHVEARVTEVCEAIRATHRIDGRDFRFAAWPGVAITGHARMTPTQLLDQASAAAAEARLAGHEAPLFHTDAVRVRAQQRLDLVHELRDALNRGEIGLRYLPRHELAGGAVAAMVAYLQWPHVLRGRIAPANFLAIAEGTGIGRELSKAALRVFCNGFAPTVQALPSSVRLSFGPLRDHLLAPDFADDVEDALREHGVPPERVEIRIAERWLAGRAIPALERLAQQGVVLVADEVGREGSSLTALSRLPLRGLQVDRAWVSASATDPRARAVCRAVAALASSFGLEPLATGVDDATTRAALLAQGYSQGTGDLYLPAAPPVGTVS